MLCNERNWKRWTRIIEQQNLEQFLKSNYFKPGLSGLFLMIWFSKKFTYTYEHNLSTNLSPKMETILTWFMDFLSQYNVFGVAIGLLIATKVWALVTGLIDDLITPLILKPVLTKMKIKKIEDLSYKGILYGKVLSLVIDFTITAFIIFLFVHYADISIVKK